MALSSFWIQWFAQGRGLQNLRKIEIIKIGALGHPLIYLVQQKGERGGSPTLPFTIAHAEALVSLPAK